MAWVKAAGIVLVVAVGSSGIPVRMCGIRPAVRSRSGEYYSAGLKMFRLFHVATWSAVATGLGSALLALGMACAADPVATPTLTASPTPPSVLGTPTPLATATVPVPAPTVAPASVTVKTGYCGSLCSREFWDGSPDAEDVLAEIRSGVDLGASGVYSSTPLHFAVGTSGLDIVSLLLEHGAEIDAPDDRGRQPLYRLGSNPNGQSQIVDVLVASGADIGSQDHLGWTPLHTLARAGNPEIIEAMLRHGADPMALTNAELTPLHQAAAWNADHGPAVMALLLDHGANLEAKSESGTSPLLYAAWLSPFPGNIEFLLDRGADLRSKTVLDSTALHLAAIQNPSPKVTQLLLDSGASLTAKDHEGQTPIHYAAAANRIEIVSLLLNAGADINARDQFGWTPLHTAVFADRDVEFVQELVGLGANVHLRTNDGSTSCEIGDSNQVDPSLKSFLCPP